MNDINLVNEGFTKEELEAVRDWFGVYKAVDKNPTETHLAANRKLNLLLSSPVPTEEEQRMIKTVQYLTRKLGYASQYGVINSFSKYYNFDLHYASKLLIKMLREEKYLTKKIQPFFGEDGKKKNGKVIVTKSGKEE